VNSEEIGSEIEIETKPKSRSPTLVNLFSCSANRRKKEKQIKNPIFSTITRVSCARFPSLIFSFSLHNQKNQLHFHLLYFQAIHHKW